MKYTANFDGACEWWVNPDTGKSVRNPGGIATYGWIIWNDGQKVAYGYGEACRGDGATNNVAEYSAIISLLKACAALAVPIKEIRGDSQLVVYQISGKYDVNSDLLRPLHKRVMELLPADCTVTWVKREKNVTADLFSRRAYRLAKQNGHDEAPWEFRMKVVPGGKQ